MKEIGRTSNVTKEMTDKIFEEGHKGISVGDNVGTKVLVDAFTLYVDEKDGKTLFSLKFWDNEGQDWYTGSQVFIKDFMRLAKEKLEEATNMFPEPMQITICKEKSQSNRDYYYIEEAPKKEASTAWRSMEW